MHIIASRYFFSNEQRYNLEGDIFTLTATFGEGEQLLRQVLPLSIGEHNQLRKCLHARPSHSSHILLTLITEEAFDHLFVQEVIPHTLHNDSAAVDNLLLGPHTRLLPHAGISVLEEGLYLLQAEGELNYELDVDDPILFVSALIELEYILPLLRCNIMTISECWAQLISLVWLMRWVLRGGCLKWAWWGTEELALVVEGQIGL